MFIKRCLELSIEKGMVSMVTMQSWMFLSSFEKFRQFLLNTSTILSMAHIGTRGFDSIGGEVVSTTAFVLGTNYPKDYEGLFFQLVDGKFKSQKQSLFQNALLDNTSKNLYRKSSADFKLLPQSQIVYSFSKNELKLFGNKRVESLGEQRLGIQTGNNSKFLRYFFEINHSSFNSVIKSSENMSKKIKWVPLNKGGGFRKWYGNKEFVINWYNNGQDIKAYKKQTLESGKIEKKNSECWNESFYFLSGISWSRISSDKFGCRYEPVGSIFETASPTMFFSTFENQMFTLGLYNSCVSKRLTKLLSPTLTFQSGDLKCLPLPTEKVFLKKEIILSLIDISKKDWDTYETSWDFKTNPFLNQDIKSYDLKTAYEKIRAVWLNMTNEMKRLEKENNEIFISAYGLEDELSPEVPLNEITLTCNPNYRYGNSKSQHELENLLLSDTIKEFISYSVGCMFGRYSIDKKGLVLADQGQNLDDFHEIVKNPLFMPDKDNVIPIMDIDWFKDDMAERFKQFLKTVSGEENYEKNLEFIENAIGKDIRKFFLNDFYNYHVKMYKKRPVYWLFSSPNGSFNAFIYMHRYRKDTVSIVLNDYLREFRAKLEAALENFIHIESSLEASQKEKLKAKKEEEKIKKVINEIEEYEREVLYPLASEQIEIDLDDGVKVNYPKFGKALKKIPGLSD
jgi:hypothetical protein